MAVIIPLPPVEILRKLLDYNPETGKLYWRPRTPDMFSDGKRPREWNCNNWNSKNAGKEAGWLSEGYIDVKINCIIYKSHRIIWAIHYGVEPENEPDHINGNPSDNRIKNLRDATRSQQSINTKIYSSNTTGVRGVQWYKDYQKFGVFITFNKKKMCLGFFDDLDQAKAVRLEAEIKYHGSFRRLDNNE